jgi:hydroxyacylglutathione hydrolase
MSRVLVRCLLLTCAACASSTQTVEVGEATVVTVRLSYNNVHHISQGETSILVDAGLESDAEQLDAKLRSAGIDPAGIDLIVVTHGHADHAGGAGWFQSTYGVPVLVGAGDDALYASGENDTLCPTDATAENRLEAAQSATYTPLVPDIQVQPGEAVDLATTMGLAGTVTSVPGHTEGSLVYTVGEAAFVGDLIRGSITGRKARTHFYMCDLEDNTDDVKHVLDEVAVDAETYFVGHFGPLPRLEIGAWAGYRWAVH